jgi:hypothetical protein
LENVLDAARAGLAPQIRKQAMKRVYEIEKAIEGKSADQSGIG